VDKPHSGTLLPELFGLLLVLSAHGIRRITSFLIHGDARQPVERANDRSLVATDVRARDTKNFGLPAEEPSNTRPMLQQMCKKLWPLPKGSNDPEWYLQALVLTARLAPQPE
jgi:hypothetical protein